MRCKVYLKYQTKMGMKMRIFGNEVSGTLKLTKIGAFGNQTSFVLALFDAELRGMSVWMANRRLKRQRQRMSEEE